MVVPAESVPVGYCPFCDHLLMQAGVCPECGKAILQAQLRGMPRRQRRMRCIKALVLIAIVAGLFFGGRSVFRANYHYRLYSFATLLESEPENPAAREELLRRLRENLLSDADIVAMIQRDYSFRLGFVRSEHPIDMPLAFRVSIRQDSRRSEFFKLCLPQKGRMLELSECTLDDSDIHFVETYSNQKMDRTSPYVQSFGSIAPPIPAGKHTLTVSGICTFECTDRRAAKILANRLQSGIPFTLSETFDVSDETYFSLLGCEFNEAQAVEAQENFQLSIGRESNGAISFSLCANRIAEDSFLAATLESTGMGETRLLKTDRKRLRASEESQDWFIGRVAAPSDGDRFRVRVGFDAQGAFRAKAGHCFPAVLEWKDITQDSIPDINARFSDVWRCRSPFGRPTEIVRALTREEATLAVDSQVEP